MRIAVELFVEDNISLCWVLNIDFSNFSSILNKVADIKIMKKVYALVACEL